MLFIFVINLRNGDFLFSSPSFLSSSGLFSLPPWWFTVVTTIDLSLVSNDLVLIQFFVLWLHSCLLIILSTPEILNFQPLALNCNGSQPLQMFSTRVTMTSNLRLFNFLVVIFTWHRNDFSSHHYCGILIDTTCIRHGRNNNFTTWKF